MVRWTFISATGCGHVKETKGTLVYTLLYKVVLILQSIGNQHSNRKRFTFHETKISNEEVIAPGTVVFQQVEIVPILESSGTCFTKMAVLFITSICHKMISN
jgi:hypothetical protein